MFLVRCFEDIFVGFAVCACVRQAISTERKTKPGTVHQSNAAIRRQRWVLFPTPQPWTLILARICSTEDLYVCGFVCKNFSAANQKGHSVDHIQDLFLSDEFVPSSARACIVFWYANSCVVRCFAGVFWSPMAACHRSCSKKATPGYASGQASSSISGVQQDYQGKTSKASPCFMMMMTLHSALCWHSTWLARYSFINDINHTYWYRRVPPATRPTRTAVLENVMGCMRRRSSAASSHDDNGEFDVRSFVLSRVRKFAFFNIDCWPSHPGVIEWAHRHS